jgi:hypothetical protein
MIWWEYRRSDPAGVGETEVVSDMQLSVEMGITNIHVQAFSYKRETCCQLILDGLLVKCIHFLTKGLFMCVFFLIPRARTEGKSNNTEGQVL